MNNEERDTLLLEIHNDLTKLSNAFARVEERVRFQWWVIGFLVTGYVGLIAFVAKNSH